MIKIPLEIHRKQNYSIRRKSKCNRHFYWNKTKRTKTSQLFNLELQTQTSSKQYCRKSQPNHLLSTKINIFNRDISQNTQMQILRSLFSWKIKNKKDILNFFSRKSKRSILYLKMCISKDIIQLKKKIGEIGK